MGWDKGLMLKWNVAFGETQRFFIGKMNRLDAKNLKIERNGLVNGYA